MSVPPPLDKSFNLLTLKSGHTVFGINLPLIQYLLANRPSDLLNQQFCF
jgi:hypothetical protein